MLKGGLIAIAVSLGAMLFYIWIRFEWQFSIGAILALFHDVLITMGIFSLIGLEVNLSIVAAILTFLALFALMKLGQYFASDPNHWFGYISFMKHFQSFSRGVLDSSDVIYFILFISTFLTLTIRRLDSDRLSG